MLLPRFYLFYIHIIVLRYIAFSQYIFVVFMGVFALNLILFMVFFHAFSLLRLSASRLAWLEIRLVLSAFYHPATEFFAL